MTARRTSPEGVVAVYDPTSIRRGHDGLPPLEWRVVSVPPSVRIYWIGRTLTAQHVAGWSVSR